MVENKHNFFVKLDARVDILSERIAALEAITKKEKSILKKISEYGGVIALALSLILGSFTLYDELVRKPKEAVKEAAETRQLSLRNSISELSKIQAEIRAIDPADVTAQQKVGAYAVTLPIL